MLLILVCGAALGVGIDELIRGDWINGIIGCLPLAIAFGVAIWERAMPAQHQRDAELIS